VFVNKAIFSAPPPSLRSAQVSFATFHFFITTVVLYTLSQPVIGVFEAKRVDILKVLPLSLAMVANVVLQNAALANSSIQFNQVARVLLTPACAALNFIMYRQTLPWKAGLTLIPICVGVAVVSYFDTKSGDALNKPKETAPIGVVFALAGVCASAMYTVWVKPFHVKLECDSYQLLLNQSAVSVGAMLYIIPFSDNKAVWLQLPSSTWALVGLSGLLAACINISQFVIIKEAGAVSSTVVGHLKTCSIILLGWITSSHSFKDMSVIGFILAVSGIIM
ncbi:putative solute carrier family 35 member E3, partial [Dissoconium aciculare CBS 342.82]|uniref:GDP-mannose transporter n=1 Tax=Dissoconium aciculare CBS 342.82 TaxID=1314786 RepID=A0A6J3MA72_9PEZI